MELGNRRVPRKALLAVLPWTENEDLAAEIDNADLAAWPCAIAKAAATMIEAN